MSVVRVKEPELVSLYLRMIRVQLSLIPLRTVMVVVRSTSCRTS